MIHLIYFFNGVEPSGNNWIIQPILAWGCQSCSWWSSCYRGGHNWWIVAAYVPSSCCQPAYPPVVNVNPGDQISAEYCGWVVAATATARWTGLRGGLLKMSRQTLLPTSTCAIFLRRSKWLPGVSGSVPHRPLATSFPTSHHYLLFDKLRACPRMVGVAFTVSPQAVLTACRLAVAQSRCTGIPTGKPQSSPLFFTSSCHTQCPDPS